MRVAACLTPVLLLLVAVTSTDGQNCDPGELKCKSGERCIPTRYLCDGDNDCADGLDEDPEMCKEWKSPDCDKGHAQCTRNGNTACTEIEEYCTATRPICVGDLDLRLCSMLNESRLAPITEFVVPVAYGPATGFNTSLALGAKFRNDLNATLSHPDCPKFSTRVAGQCLSLFYVGAMSWGEGRAFCQHLGGDLLTFANVSHYYDVVSHLNDNQVTSDFWVGGLFQHDTQKWAWLDNTPMPLGTPFWALRRYDVCSPRDVALPGGDTHQANGAECYHYQQAPADPVNGYCTALTYTHRFYFTDEDCLTKRSPLCLVDEVEKE